MGNVHSFEMGKPKDSLNMYKICNLAHSKMVDDCCDSLSKCEIPQLDHLHLYKCQISCIGFSHIFQCQFTNLTKLTISKSLFI